MAFSGTPHGPYSSTAIPLRNPILTVTSKAYQTTHVITRLATRIPQLSPIQARQSSAVVRMNRAYAEVCAGKLSLPDAEGIISGAAQEIDEISEQVDDYIIFWDEGSDIVVDGVALEWDFVRYEGERGVLERRRKRVLAEGVLERVRDQGGS